MKPQHNHPEAFRLMLYVSKDRSVIETIWNSRDGVTPFIVGARDTVLRVPDDEGTALQHDLWSSDPYALFHVPNVGDRIFVDATEALLRPRAEKFVVEGWERDPYPMKMFYGSQPEAVEKCLADWCRPGAPDVVVVDRAMQQRFLKSRMDVFGPREQPS